MNVLPFKSGREPPRNAKSAMETKIFTLGEIGAWRIPPFQRPVRTNEKVRALTEEIRVDGGVIPGIITLGTVKTEEAIYIVDGQHRLEAFRNSGLPEFLADVRFIRFETMAEMAEEFVRLNSSLVRMRPDDVLRGLEASVKALSKIRRECKFVGYDQIRRGTTSPILGMSMLLRVWHGSQPETPVNGGMSAVHIAETISDDSVEELIQFLTVAHSSWGRDAEYARLWSSLNLGLCMWCWRRLVKDPDRTGNKRYIHLNIRQFANCLMALSSDSHYLDWLQGRQISDRDRGPAYGRIKKIWTARLRNDVRSKIAFPQPAWATK